MASGYNIDRTHPLPYWTGFEPIDKHFIWEHRDACEITMLPKSWQSTQDLLEPMCIQDPKNSVQTAWRIVVIPSLAINTLNAFVTCRNDICIDISRKVLQSNTVWCRKTVAIYTYIICLLYMFVHLPRVYSHSRLR